MSKHNLSDFTNEEPTVEATAEPEVETKEEAEAKTGEEVEALELTELAETEEKPQKRQKPVQERIDKIVAEREYWRGVAEGRIKPETAEAEPTAPEGTDKPNPEAFEFGEADPAYLEALTDWKVDQKLAAHSQKQEISQQAQQLETNYAQHVAAAREELPDYDEVVTKAAARKEFPCSEELSLLIKASPVGPKVAYHLATNLDDAIAIDQMPPFQRAAAFGVLAAHVSGQPQEAKPEPKVTQAPPPPKFQSRGSGGQFETSERQLYRKMLKEFR